MISKVKRSEQQKQVLREKIQFEKEHRKRYREDTSALVPFH